MPEILTQKIVLEESKQHVSKRRSLDHQTLPPQNDEGGIFYDLDIEEGNEKEANIFNKEKDVVIKDIGLTTASTSERQSPF